MKRIITINLIWIISLAAAYQLGRRAQISDLRQEYPNLRNIRAREGCCLPTYHDDIWITDSARVHLYLHGQGWVKLN